VRTNELISVLCHNYTSHIALLDTLKTLEMAVKKGQTRFYKESVSELLLPYCNTSIGMPSQAKISSFNFEQCPLFFPSCRHKPTDSCRKHLSA